MKFEFIGPVVSEEKIFENVDGPTDARVTDILTAHLRGELKWGKI